MDKTSVNFEGQADWGDYEVLVEISIYPFSTDSASADSEILPRKRKRARLLMRHANEPFESVGTLLEERICKEVLNMNVCKRYQQRLIVCRIRE
ncbi:hypothetical protein Trydic_g20742 [Trypoxylus dichotomus]